MRIKERFTLAKSGCEEKNEDGIYIGNNFIAVIDGATSKSAGTIDGVSSGRFAMLTIKEAFDLANPLDEPYDIIFFLNNYLKNKLKQKNLPKNAESPIASVVYCNLVRNEVVSYGDCLYSIDGKIYKQEKKSDIKCAFKRATIIKELLKNGHTEESIRQNDLGRQAILPELKHHADAFANNSISGGYPCIAANNPVKQYLKVHKVKRGTSIILASDGYKVLESTFEQTEKKLSEMLERDLLCINELLGTKCVQKGNLSFDDRTYVSFEL